MDGAREQYRRLPGVGRGFIQGASVWMGADHLLLVKSMRFREDYKRFHLRDVQAIVVAATPRFEVSTRAALVAIVWVMAYFAFRNRAGWAAEVLWLAAAGLVGAWIYVCAACSCRCRLFTAVSRDDLPSVYRTWTARRFLAAVEPRIHEVQGVLEGNWAEAVEGREVGPPAAPAGARAGAGVMADRPAARRRTVFSDIFVASLFADALLNLFTLNGPTRTVQWVWYGLAFIQIAMAVLLFVQHHRGVLRREMQRLAVATLIVMGLAYYARAAMSGMVSAGSQLFPDLATLSSTPGYVLVREIDAGIMLVLGIIGAGLSLTGEDA